MTKQDEKDTSVLPYREDRAPYTLVLKPIRTFQFVSAIFLFFVTVYILFIPSSPVPTLVTLTLIILNGIYAVIMSLEIIFQYGEKNLPITPMFTFSMLGFVLFFLASLFVLMSPYESESFTPVRLIIVFLGFVLSLFFLIDVLIVLAIWKSRCAMYRKCCLESQALVEERFSDLPPIEPMKYDTTTSVSSIKISPTNGETTDTTKPAELDHSKRRVTIGHKKEYVDAPTSPPSVSEIKIAEIQTEPTVVTVVESQTCKCELKEVLVQTASRCEMCNQHLQNFGRDPSSSLVNLTSTNCAPCATVFKLLRGGINLQCDSSCNCKTGIVEIEEQKPDTEIKKIDPTPEKQSIDETEQHVTENQVQTVIHQTDNATQAIRSYTKMTVTVHCASPITPTMEVTTSSGSKEKIVTTYIPLPTATLMERSSKDEFMIEQNQENDRNKSLSVTSESIELEKNTIDNDETKMSFQIKYDKDNNNTENKKNDVKELRSSQVPRTSKPDNTTNNNIITIKSQKTKDNSLPIKNQKKLLKKSGNSKTESRKKKDDDRTYSRFIPLDDIKPKNQGPCEQEYQSNLCLHELTDEIQHCNRNKISSSIFQRNNRIDPACMQECNNYPIQIEDSYPKCVDTRAEQCITHQTAATITDICPTCRKEKIPQTDIFQYYSIYKDNEGRVYCYLCAPTYSNKIHVPIITDQSNDILQDCSICGNFPYIIDVSGIGNVNKHDEKPIYCIKCGRLQS